MRNFVMAMLIAAAPFAADAAEYRTVQWFADHPDVMRNVLKLCRDNAGLAARNPNCANADEAGTLVVERELNARGGSGVWASHPAERSQILWACRIAQQPGRTIDPTTAKWCAEAR